MPNVFLDDFDHPTKLPINSGNPCLIDERSGRKVYLQDVRFLSVSCFVMSPSDGV